MLEVLADSEWFKISTDWIELDLLTQDLWISIERFNEMNDLFKQLWLMQYDEEYIYNQNLIERMQPLLKKREVMRKRYESQGQPNQPPTREAKKETPKMTEEQFEFFWSKYPVKEWKKKVKDKFLKLNPKLFDTIIAGIDKHAKGKKRQQWFITMPETFINQERRNDEVPEFINTPKNNEPSNGQNWRTQSKVSTSWTADEVID